MLTLLKCLIIFSIHYHFIFLFTEHYNNHSINHMIFMNFQHYVILLDDVEQWWYVCIDFSFLRLVKYVHHIKPEPQISVWVRCVCFLFIYKCCHLPERIWSCCYSQPHQSLGVHPLRETSISGSLPPAEPHMCWFTVFRDLCRLAQRTAGRTCHSSLLHSPRVESAKVVNSLGAVSVSWYGVGSHYHQYPSLYQEKNISNFRAVAQWHYVLDSDCQLSIQSK